MEKFDVINFMFTHREIYDLREFLSEASVHMECGSLLCPSLPLTAALTVTRQLFINVERTGRLAHTKVEGY